MLADRDGPLLVPAHQHEVERALQRAQGFEQVVRIGDGLTAGRDDQVACIDAGRVGQAVVLDATDEDAITLRETDRATHPPRDVGRSDRDTQARGAGRFAAAKRIHALTQGGVRGKGQVEALADAVRVDAD